MKHHSSRYAPPSQLPTDDIKADNSCSSEPDKSKSSRHCLVETLLKVMMIWQNYVRLLRMKQHGAESGPIAKAYANDWAAAITAVVQATENESHLLTKADLIRTEGYEENLRLYVEEERRWMRNKYGFNSRWSMQQYVKYLYDKFFEFHPECESYRI